MTAHWRSYDSIAASYTQVAEQQCFARPAGDLVAVLELAPGSRVLDVGAGTGAVSELAARVVGPTGLVVAIDPALGMLRVLRNRSPARAVAGRLPRLPHPDRTFDAVAAAFVLTHVEDYTSALAAMTDVLRAGGRLAASSWAQSEAHTPPGRTWQAVAGRFVRDDEVQAALGEALPVQDRFAAPAFLKAALIAASLASVSVREIAYSIEMTAEAFAELRQISTSGRFIRARLPHREWVRFNEEATRALADAHGAAVSFQIRANIAAGCRAKA